VFLINIPIGLLALAVAPRLVPESRAGGARRLDLIGTALVTAALVALVLPLVEGRQLGWPAWTWACLAAAPLLLAVFALQQRALQRRGGAPLLDAALFRERGVRAGLACQLVFWCGQASFFLVLALYLQQGRGLDALQAGAVFTILAAAYLATSLRAPAMTARLGRRLIAVAALTLAAGHGLLLASVAAVGTGGSIVALVPGLLLAGAGMGLAITPLTATVMAGADAERAGALSGVLSTMQQVGNALGVAVTGVIFFGALHSGFAPAFERSLAEIAALLVVVAAMTRLLPRAR
jgi:Na+/melibiose symporter-like transporter